MKNFTKYLRMNVSGVAAIIAFALFLLISDFYLKSKKDKWEQNVRSSVMEVLIGKKSRLEKALYSRIYYTRGIAAYVSYNPNITNKEYYELAKEFVGVDSVINSMALSKDCILNAIYPLEGHEDAIGLNLLDHPERREIVEKTIETHKTFVAGPVELVEGGVAFISYTPIFDKTHAVERFWGMTDIVIKLEEYLKASGLMEHENKLKFTLKGIDGKGAEGNVFFGDPEVYDLNPVTVNIDLPYGNWVLGAIPEKGWYSYLNQDDVLKTALYAVSFLLSVLLWFLLKSERRIRKNAREQQAILNSLDNVIIEYDEKGVYVKVVSTDKGMLVKDPKDLVGKTLFDVFDSDKALLLHGCVKECLSHKQLVIKDYSLEINGEKRWFQGRFSYKSDNRVICSAYDITSNKAYEQKLQQSNDMKDKLFSIISHDLRNPVGTNNAMLVQLIDAFDQIDDAQKKKMLLSLQKSGENTLILLENLLSWSRAQKGMLIAERNQISYRKICKSVLDLMSETISQKKMEVHLNLKTVPNVIGDEQLSETIVRNILSNAIKFTHVGGSIEISTELDETNQFLMLNIKDNGIGMSEEQLSSLFQFGKASTKMGTQNESGSGLGLALCKELVEIQNGSIGAESKLDSGTTFKFGLALA